MKGNFTVIWVLRSIFPDFTLNSEAITYSFQLFFYVYSVYTYYALCVWRKLYTEWIGCSYDQSVFRMLCHSMLVTYWSSCFAIDCPTTSYTAAHVSLYCMLIFLFILAMELSINQSWAYRSLKSLNRSSLLSEPSFWERWRSLRQTAERSERTDKIALWAVRSWAI